MTSVDIVQDWLKYPSLRLRSCHRVHMTEGFAQPLRLIPNVSTGVHDKLWGYGFLINTRRLVIITHLPADTPFSVSFPH